MELKNNTPEILTFSPGRKELVLRLVPQQSDYNDKGSVFGGWIMLQMDIAAAIPAYAYTKDSNVVTVAVNSLVFFNPVYAHHELSFFTELVKVGKTSMTIEVTVYQRPLGDYNQPPVLVAQATFTFVAIDGNGRPRMLEK